MLLFLKGFLWICGCNIRLSFFSRFVFREFYSMSLKGIRFCGLALEGNLKFNLRYLSIKVGNFTLMIFFKFLLRWHYLVSLQRHCCPSFLHSLPHANGWSISFLLMICLFVYWITCPFQTSSSDLLDIMSILVQLCQL